MAKAGKRFRRLKRALRRPFEWLGIGLGYLVFTNLTHKGMLRVCDFVSAVMYRFDRKGRDNAHFNLGAKLDRGSLLSPYDWSHPRLAQTGNALVDPMCSFFEHFFLLCIEHFYYRKPFLQFCRKLLPQFFIRRMDHFQVASQIPELLSHRFSDHLL